MEQQWGGSMEIGIRFVPSGRMAWLVRWLMKRKLVSMEPATAPATDGEGVSKLTIEMSIHPAAPEPYKSPPEYGPMPSHGGKLN